MEILSYCIVALTLEGPITTAAVDKFDIFFFFSEKTSRLDIADDSHEILKTFFSKKLKKVKII